MIRLIPFSLGLALSAAAASPATASITPAVLLDRPVVPAGEPIEVHVLVRFEIPEAAPAAPGDRSPLHFALVLDRSGSMADRGKLEYAKSAARTLASMLTGQDRLAVVEYDDRITTLWPSSPAGSPDLVGQQIDRLSPRGSTNLAGGLKAGIDEILGDRHPGTVERVVLLSDGLANTGETDPRRIASLASQARSRGVAVTTMGLGRDYDEDLMQTIAQGGGGRYYYIENPSEMARLYREEMGRVLHQATRHLELWFEPAPATDRVTVYGYPNETAGRRTAIQLDDLYSGDTRTILLGVATGPTSEGEIGLGTLGLRYQGVDDDRPHESRFPVSLRATRDHDLAARSIDAAAAAEAMLIVADQAHDEAVRAFEAGDKAGAISRLDRIRADVSAAHQAYGDPKLKKKLEALELEHQDIARAEQDQEYRKGYLKQRKEAFYSSRQGKRGKYLVDEAAGGVEVEKLQQALRDAGLYTGPIDGIYSPALRQAVEAYQRAHQLEADGIAGPQTLRALGLY